MNILAIIPARGGSKGIPHKNIQPVCGKPLIAWNIEAASLSKYINRIIVSTDDEKIAAVSEKYGAEISWRPSDISGDSASSESALLQTLKYLKDSESYQPDLIVFLQCTSPLTSTDDIDSCINELLINEADCATTVTDFHYFIWKKNSEGYIDGINHDKNIRLRRQDREQQFLETGSVYVMKTEGFLLHQHRFFGKIVFSVMPEDRVHEIDVQVDLVVANVMMRNLLKISKASVLPSIIEAVIFDFDGVMTDDKVYVNQYGEESVRCGRDDGMGISMLKKHVPSLKIAVMSTEVNNVVTERCSKLGIECYQNLGNSKAETVSEWVSANNLNIQNVIFVGNDVNDIETMKIVGCSICPANANDKVLPYASLVLNSTGGDGAVRELCDLILNL